MDNHTEAEVGRIGNLAQQMRIDVLKMVQGAQSGHIGGAFSAAEIVACLYFGHMRLDPDDPAWEGRDRFYLSKGHASALLYSALARKGFFPQSELATFRTLGTRLEGHPEPRIPGVEAVAGPLGHGVALAAGAALGLRYGSHKPMSLTHPSNYTSQAGVFTLLGDGELDAGLIWEGAMLAAKYRLGNLTAIVDYNGVQQTGPSSSVMPLEPLRAKWSAFGWHVQEINGHSVRQILEALDLARQVHSQPSVLIARTTKGRGVGFMEYDHRWHGGVPGPAEHERAIRELEEGLQRWV